MIFPLQVHKTFAPVPSLAETASRLKPTDDARHDRGGSLTMDYLDLTLPTPEANLALDEALLLEAEAGRADEVLRSWELPNHAVVLGSSCRLAADVDEATCAADGVPVLRRSSGGGTVLLGPGCLAYSLVLAMEQPPLRDVTHSYLYILERIGRALTDDERTVIPAGTSDLALGDTKVSGNSQRRLRTHVLHHGTVLYNFEIAHIGRYLKPPERQPAYRRGRNHEGFVSNLPLSAAQIKERLRQAWSAHQDRPDWPRAAVERLVREKYANPAWTRRR